MHEVSGWLYDGKTSARQSARVRLSGGRFSILSGDGASELYTFKKEEVLIRERVGEAPRAFEFPGLMRFETHENDVVDKHMMGRTGMGVVNWFERNWGAVAFSILFLIAFTYLGYRYALPVVAKKIAYASNEKVLKFVSNLAIEYLEENFEPSTLEEEDAARVAEVFLEVKALFPGHKVTLHKYRGKSSLMNVNAFALPDGSIVMLDGLAELLTNKDEMKAVLLHEMGHVVYRHGMQSMIQGLVVSGFFLYVSGGADWSSVFGALTMSAYSRDHEREADYFAANELRKLGKPASALAEALKRMEEKLKLADMGIPGFLSSHPLTGEREKYLRSYDPPKPAGEKSDPSAEGESTKTK